MRAPQRRDAIEKRQRAVGILRDIPDGEIIGHERGDEAPDGSRHHHELPGDRRGHRGHPALAGPHRAHDAEERLQAREQQRENQGKVTELRPHRQLPAGEGARATGAGASSARDSP